MSSFHWDAWLIFLVLSFVIMAVVKVIVGKVIKFLQHVIWMRRRVKGTLAKDIEADYWLKLINRPDWKPIWRWFYAEEYKKSSFSLVTAEVQRKSSLRHRLVFVNVVLVVLILATGIAYIVFRDDGGPIISQDIDTKTAVAILSTDNMTWGGLVPGTNNTWILTVNDAKIRDISLLVRIDRTDLSFADRDVTFGVYSESFKRAIDNETDVSLYYVTNATYFLNQDILELYGSSEFGIRMPMARAGIFIFGVTLHIKAYTGVPQGTEMVKITTTGTDFALSIRAPRPLDTPIIG